MSKNKEKVGCQMMQSFPFEWQLRLKDRTHYISMDLHAIRQCIHWKRRQESNVNKMTTFTKGYTKKLDKYDFSLMKRNTFLRTIIFFFIGKVAFSCRVTSSLIKS